MDEKREFEKVELKYIDTAFDNYYGRKSKIQNGEGGL